MFGVTKQVQVRRMEECEQCKGSGRRARQGAHQLHHLRRTRPDALPAGLLLDLAHLQHLRQGSGKLIVDPCNQCRGQGRIARDRTVTVKVPAGVDEGARILYSGEGEAGSCGGPPGDLYVVLHVKEHSFFERDGKDLYCVVPISFAQAALGTEIKVPTLEGEHTLKVPEGTQTGTHLQAEEQRRAGAERPRPRRPVRRGQGADAGKAQQAPARAAAGAGRTRPSVENKPVSRSLLNKVKEIFG